MICGLKPEAHEKRAQISKESKENKESKESKGLLAPRVLRVLQVLLVPLEDYIYLLFYTSLHALFI
jgi:hypothetical protein